MIQADNYQNLTKWEIWQSGKPMIQALITIAVLVNMCHRHIFIQQDITPSPDQILMVDNEDCKNLWNIFDSLICHFWLTKLSLRRITWKFFWILSWVYREISTSSIDYGHDDDLERSLTNDYDNEVDNDLKQPGPPQNPFNVKWVQKKRDLRIIWPPIKTAPSLSMMMMIRMMKWMIMLMMMVMIKTRQGQMS